MNIFRKNDPEEIDFSDDFQGGLKPTLQDKTGDVFYQIRRFGWDLAGVFLILISVLSLLGFLGISKGSLLNSWVWVLKHNFGWGSIPFVLSLAGLGILCFRHRAGKDNLFTLGRVIALEGAFFTLLPLMSLFGGGSFTRAEAGQDGGILGWGLANILWPVLPSFLAAFIYTVIFLILLILGTGLLRPLYHLLLRWADSETSPAPKPEPSNRAAQRRSEQQKIEPDIDIAAPSWRDDRLPPLNLLLSDTNWVPDEAQIRANARTIEKTLAEFNIPARVIGYRVGPTVTQYALEPGFIEKVGSDGEVVKQKVKVAQIASLNRDLALRLSASRLRIETPVPGRSYVGIEVPNAGTAMVRLRGVLESDEFRKLSSPLALGLGRNVAGDAVVADLAKMPHLLIAGTTNSGKSVCITAITACLVMNNTPSELKLVMLDPKMVELVRYNGIPHLLGKVETELERMLAVLRWALVEMDSRYRLLETAHSRDLADYNRKMRMKKQPTLPNIVIMIDELADLMLNAPDQTEHSLIRLAQMARATGIHLIVATQRPSTDVVTGLIKANFPARISFLVASSVDSRVVLDMNGAESLLGKGDMLLLDPQKGNLQRAQGVMVSDREIEKVLSHWQRMSQNDAAEAPWEGMIEAPRDEHEDEMIDQAIAVVRAAGKASTSLLQRRLRIGFPRAASLIDQLEERGIVGPSVGSGKDREVLIDSEDDTEDEDY